MAATGHCSITFSAGRRSEPFYLGMGRMLPMKKNMNDWGNKDPAIPAMT